MERGHMDSSTHCYNDWGIETSMFDYSVENHLRRVDRIAKLCGEFEDDASFKKTDIVRLSSKITFLREWRHFNYKPRNIRFAFETEHPPKKNVVGEIKMSQFSAATVPKVILSSDTPPGSSKDFVLYVGGVIWALDWCPKVDSSPEQPLNCEFIAVSAHPPESSYHKMGAPLIGRGMVQIWCLLHVATKGEEAPLPAKRRGRPKKIILNTDSKAVEPKRPTNDKAIEAKRPRGGPESIKATQPKRPRGRPKKILSRDNDLVKALAVEYPNGSSERHEVSFIAAELNAQNDINESSKGFSQAGNSSFEISKERMTNTTVDLNCRDGIFFSPLTLNVDPVPSANSEQDLLASMQMVPDNYQSLELSSNENSIPPDLALPRVVFCLAHNGKVAWDLKWRPCTVHDSECKSRMGYLAVLLGNGSLEVWEVPSPSIMKIVYSHSEGTDPRFVKMDPVFRCSKLQCGQRQSIPLALEWSTSVPHDLLLAGCHDGTVALWKFSAGDSCKDTRPLLCFNADTDAIRALAWAPSENDPEAANVIATAGHEGIKFWDIRDPFRPLWDLNLSRRIIYSLDWLSNPRCIILSFDDGTLRILGLLNAAFDVSVTGKPFSGTQFQGCHCYSCSPFTIWSVHASRAGKVAYCTSDGTTLNFQLTTKAVDKEPFRNKAPHFLCGSLTDEDPTLVIGTSFQQAQTPLKKPPHEWGNASHGCLYQSNQVKSALEPRENGQKLDDQILSLCYGDEAGMEFMPDSPLTSLVGKQVAKSSSCSKKGLSYDRALVSAGEEQQSSMGLEGFGEEAPPPKIVAMNRVRWNMNRGGERWLCYGGAAGILRCQEIFRSNVHQ